MDRTSGLRLSLLLALGLLPAACGGSALDGSDEGGSADPTPNDVPTGGGSAGEVGGDSGGSRALTCTSPTLDEATGLVQCAEGYGHRPERTTCGEVSGSSDAPAKPRAPHAPAETPCFGQGPSETLSDCSEYHLGYCHIVQSGSCRSGCYADEDCEPGHVCECGHSESPSGGVCVPAVDCATDADCDSGMCATYYGGCQGPGYACISEDDRCWSSSDCPPKVPISGTCGYDTDLGHRTCSYCVVGRPFLVSSEMRLPPLTERADWANVRLEPRVEHLTTTEREKLAAHWARLGQMEHASIAAFARFSLQLLALGAPPALVEQCTQALADETAHARLCFGIASAYAGRALGPGPLDVSGSLDTTSLVDVVDLVLVEGCFGETNAALEALDAAASADDPVIADAYARIARDEQRHAELAFRFVGWALEQGGAAVAQRVHAAMTVNHPHVARNVAVPCLGALLEQRSRSEGSAITVPTSCATARRTSETRPNS